MPGMKKGIRLKRVYQAPAKSDGMRILVDRIWPRGVRKDDADIHFWIKGVAPSTELRKWFAHDLDRWRTFRRRYKAELTEHADEIRHLRRLARIGTITLVFGARDEAHNNAVVLKQVLENQ